MAVARTLHVVVGSALALALWLLGAPTAQSAPTTTIIDGSTPGYYLDALGSTLDGTGPQFPCADGACGDPTASFPPPAGEPNLSPAAGVLGGWLASPPVLAASWSGLQPIPATWATNTETAIVYPIDAGGGLTGVTVSLGVDNGIFVWLDGAYRFGATAPGLASSGEYVVPLGDLAPGLHHLQILRADHGGATGYTISVEATANAAPDCAAVVADRTSLWPPNHELAAVALAGASDAEDGALAVAVTAVTQDEPVAGAGDGRAAPDALIGAAGEPVQLRAERAGGGDGRVYRVAYTATDSAGAACTGVVAVEVPHDRRGAAAVDSGDSYDSTAA